MGFESPRLRHWGFRLIGFDVISFDAYNSVISVPFDFGDKKAADFSHSATSGRSDFRYSVFSNLLAANGLSKPFADGKSTGDSRFSGARGCSHLDGTK